MARVKKWCFTLNHYTQADFDVLFPMSNGVVSLNPLLLYCIVGREIGLSGTPHLQGFLVFKDRCRMGSCKAFLPRAHWEAARTTAAAIEYCKKEGDFIERGESPPPDTQGKRNDIHSFKESVATGTLDRRELREEHSLVCALYPRFVEAYLRDQVVIPEPSAHPFRVWQQSVLDIVAGTPSPRLIHFIVDFDGNAGKSWLAAWLEYHHEKNVQVMKPGKHADMSYEYKEDTEIFILDCPRSKQGDFIQYDFLENIKDGRVFSPKYESTTKRFVIPHVFVFMNEEPDMSKLSSDRYDIHYT